MSTTRMRVLAALLVSGTLLATSMTPAVAGTTLSANLKGSAEVPGPGDPDGQGHATITVYPKRHELCFALRWSAIRRPTMAHIHRGLPGVAGPVRVTLFSSTTPLPGHIHAVKGCVHGLGTKLLRHIKNTPGRFYVNIHNVPYPSGAIRGRLT